MELRNKQNLYVNLYVKKFVNNFLKAGKKIKVENFFFDSLCLLKVRFKLDALYICLFILEEIRPVLELKSLRLGSVIYKIPVPLIKEKQLFKAIKLFSKSLHLEKVYHKFTVKFLEEVCLILRRQSQNLKHNQQLYKIASNNRAFAHFRW